MQQDREQKQILNRYRGLLRSCRNSVTRDDVKQISKAIKEVTKLYADKRTAAGNPYVYHLIDVARICVDEIGLGGTSIVAALLHDTITDKLLSLIEIEKRYSPTIANIVDGLSKITSLDPKDPNKQAENFRELILTLSTDARVILIKLADRLEEMRSLSAMPPDIRLKLSWETYHLYAPLAHRLGLYRLKSEMEDLAMKYTNEADYRMILRKLKNTTTRRNKFIREFIEPIEGELTKKGFDFEVKGRPKTVYSIWKKMQKKGVGFDEVYDVFAIRVILNSPPDSEKSDCWQVYSIITDSYTPNPERLRDWISVPKSNGYESLQTTVVGPDGKWVEVQIRSKRMDDIAERGLAAHWKYKGIKQDRGLDQWVEKVREILETPVSAPEEFVDQFKLNLYQNEVFAFTPNGDLRKYPQGATILDFAFDIHSDVGSKCVGAKVNGRNVPIKQPLQNGDVIEIITSKNQKPKTDWLQIVITGKARSKIKQCLREDKNKQLSLGKEMLYRRLKNWKISDTDEAIATLQKHLKLRSIAELFELISLDRVNLTELKAVLVKAESHEADQSQIPEEPIKPRVKDGKELSSTDYLVIDEKLVDVDYKLAKCCNPIFGDSIFGFVTINEGIKIHRTSCPNAAQLHRKYGYRVVNAKWKETKADTSFQTSIKIVGFDELGIVNRISELISKDLKVNMRSFSMNSSNGMFEGRIQVFVSDTKHLETLLYRLGRIKGVQKAVRVGGEV
ncbi:RelA/SpoT family protein [Perlabentimonas gracilis]|uniref:RelA/SpoT family protein n=1 Tax=Perlabentimonas gracilis TaxID=2715279 RepID=UPI00140E1C23|nr:RelA/SpoT family protein [Perlabentimonas gracilis]NHB67432.1 bifunctional (p)ppGpp synthetase/guanosine-3',5'-bis(diphosphate) 3'-pyrophosphohydrolase [Perlabentimonas gracilis]